MTAFPFRAATFAVAFVGALGASQVSSHAAWAQAKAAKAPLNLTFSMSARVFYKDGTSAAAPAQSIDAQVWLSGRRARLDTTISGRPLRLLFSPPYAYRLLPAARIGQRFRASGLPGLGSVVPGSQGFSPDPASIRAALISGGARKTGSAVVGGVAVDVYSSKRFRGRADTVKAFLRKSDALPTRVEIESKSFSAVASWRNYQKPRALSAALFAIPAGFRIREAQNPGGM